MLHVSRIQIGEKCTSTLYIKYLAGLQIYSGPRSLCHDYKIWFITFQGSGPHGPTFLVVKKSLFNKKSSPYSKSMNSTKQKVHVGSQYSKTCLKQLLKKEKKYKLLINKWYLNEGQKYCRMIQGEHSAILLTCIK